MRVLLDPTAQPAATTVHPFWERGAWPASWLSAQPGVTWFRRAFAWPGGRLRIHVSADQRYRLFIDGTAIGVGPERGDIEHWRFASHDLDLPAGTHVLVAQVWWLNDAPLAQATIRPAFLCLGEGDAHPLLTTGVAPWEHRPESGWSPLPKGVAWGTGCRTHWRVDADLLAAPTGGGGGWQPATANGPAFRRGTGGLHHGATWQLEPATLPEQEERLIHAGTIRRGDAGLLAVLAGGTVAIPAGATRRALIDLGEYRCAYAEVTAVGTGTVELSWAEALFSEETGEAKANRAQVDGLHFRGVADRFTFTGPGGTISPLWWQAGRFVELVATAGEAPLELRGIAWRETGYPLRVEARFACSDAALDACLPLLERVLRRCAHETFMDCPYYEQLQYTGDTRLECLVTRAYTRDHRLVDKALRTFGWSLREDGLLSSRYPTCEWQQIPTFSLMWIGMLHDTLRYGDQALVRAHLGTMRAVRERFASHVDAAGRVGWMPGWNFVDWVPSWRFGEVPGGFDSTSCIIGWQLAYTLGLCAEIEDWAGEPALAERNRDLARRIAGGCDADWDADRGRYRDGPGLETASEHAQILALLSGFAPAERVPRLLATLAEAPDLARSTVYFSHYLFEVAARFRRPELLFRRLDYWRDLPAQGFTTVPEQPEPSRSDCHAWGAHPWYHLLASVLGIRPAAPGFAAVRIAPMPGPLTHAEGVWPHALGDIRVRLDGDHGEIELPPGLPGTLVLDGREIPLAGSYRW